MAIYTRDNINYGGMLGNAMANRANYLQRRYDRVAQMGQNWGNAVSQMGQTLNNAFNQAAQYQYNQDQLANQQQFQAEQNALNRAQQLNMAREQQRFQEQQNALNRQNTFNIAQLNRNAAKEDKQDEYVLNLQKAQAHLGLVEAQYKADPNNPSLQEAYDNAKFNVAYWNKKAGQSMPQTVAPLVPTSSVNAPTPPVNQEGDGLKLDTYKQQLDDIFTNKVLTNAQIAKAKSIIDTIQDKDTQAIYLERLKAKGLSAEERNAKAAAFKAEAQASYDKLPKGITGNVKPGALARWKSEHPEYAKALGH